MYCTEGSESTCMWEQIQHYVAGTNPGTALQSDISGFSGQLLCSAPGFGALCISGWAETGRVVISADKKGVLLWHLVPLRWELALGKDSPWH